MDSVKNQSSTTAQNGEATSDKTPENSATSLSPCANRFYPVKNGWRRNYDNTVGNKSSQTEEYKDGDASFDEIKVGKAWATVYEAKGTSQMGAIEMTVTINNKIVSLEDPVINIRRNF